ncbi:MAG: HAMP domain-containing histidine kinase [Acidimicrobiia bacterium]|nr:HAMP domain-containing histidine kinase [Acidimicrobiia bacterium]
MTLRARLALFVALAVGLAVATVAVAAYRSTSDETMAQIDRFLRVRAPLAALADPPPITHQPGTGGGGGGGGLGRRDPAGVVGEDVAAQVLYADGSVSLLGTGDLVLPVSAADLAVVSGASPEVVRTVTIDGTDYRMLTRRLPPLAALQVARDLTEAQSILGALRNRLLLLGLAGVLLAGVAGWLLAGRAVRPVRDLTAAAEAVSVPGGLDMPIPVKRSDEIGRLAAAFNAMLARLEASRVSQQRLITDASHELRTPLTSLRTNIELLARGTVPDSEREAMLADLTAEVIELGALVTELVDLATVGRDEEAPVEVDLAMIVADAVARATRRATQTIDVAATSLATVVRPAAVTRAVSNLLDNAIKWSPPDGKITVTLDTTGLAVADRGPGIAAADLPFVFQRFFRSTAARSLPGSGLGLAIVAAVAEDHGWSPFARNRAGGGAEVGFHFTGGTPAPSR